MGHFLKELRLSQKEKLSQEKLSSKFYEAGVCVSTNAISKWEKGKSIPDIDKLMFLADLYHVSIDEILDGEKDEFVDFENKYYSYKDLWINRFISLDDSKNKIEKFVQEELPKITLEQFILPRKTFKELSMKFVLDSLSKKEKRELDFLLEHYYIYKESDNEKDFYSDLHDIKEKELGEKELWWEIQKMVLPISAITISLEDISDERYENDEILKKEIDVLEDWEKDQLLAMLQRQYPICYDPRTNSKMLAAYEKTHNKEYSLDEIAKNTIRYLVSKGALINNEYLGKLVGHGVNERNIDYIEKAYNTLYKPLVISTYFEGNKRYMVENTPFNRFVAQHEYDIIRPLKNYGYSKEATFDLVRQYDNVPDEIYLKEAESRGMDTNREMKYIRADLSSSLSFLEEKWHEFYQKIYFKWVDLEHYYQDFLNGIRNNQLIHFVFENEWIGGVTTKETIDYIHEKNRSMSYKDYLKSRDKNKTNLLLDKMNELPYEKALDVLGLRSL